MRTTTTTKQPTRYAIELLLRSRVWVAHGAQLGLCDGWIGEDSDGIDQDRSEQIR